MTDKQGRLYVIEAAEQWGVHENTVRNWAEAGLIKVDRIGKRGFLRILPDQTPPTVERRHPCLQAWPGGLKHGILVECDRSLREHQIAHAGKHMNRAEHMEWWGGGLTPEEDSIAIELRSRA